jgi:hypothetical protein
VIKMSSRGGHCVSWHKGLRQEELAQGCVLSRLRQDLSWPEASLRRGSREAEGG